MREESKKWWEQANSDLKAAKNSISTKDYDWACFQAQQAAEKALKALFIEKFNELKKVHDLVFLARKLNSPENILQDCIELNRVYMETRYPDQSGTIPAKKFTKENANNFINQAQRIIKWLKKLL